MRGPLRSGFTRTAFTAQLSFLVGGVLFTAMASDTTTDVSALHTSFLAFDFGLKRTGVAVGNRLTRTANAAIHHPGRGRRALATVRRGRGGRTGRQPDALVVGVPFHPDGAAHENTRRAQRFARQLRGRFGLPVFEVGRALLHHRSACPRRARCRCGRGRHHPRAIPEESSMSSLALDAEALYGELQRGVRPLLTPETRLVGIVSGGQWLAERLQADLGLPGAAGAISSAMHRDDYAKRGLAASGQTTLPFDINGADILLLDDVLYTGRTIRAVVNELFDYGRPARVRLAVLVDRGGRQLPVATEFAAARAWCCRPRNRCNCAQKKARSVSTSKTRGDARAGPTQPATQRQRRADPPAVH